MPLEALKFVIKIRHIQELLIKNLEPWIRGSLSHGWEGMWIRIIVFLTQNVYLDIQRIRLGVCIKMLKT